MQKVTNIRELFEMNLEQLKELLGPKNGKELFDFINK